jgi:type IV secretory pathway VirB2 component (pilin)
MNARAVTHNLTVQEQQTRTNRVRLYILSCMATTMATPAFAQLTEAENTANWVLRIFSPALLLTLLTLLLIGCGLAVYMGKLSGGLFVKILVGSIFIFGARTLAPKIIALF